MLMWSWGPIQVGQQDSALAGVGLLSKPIATPLNQFVGDPAGHLNTRILFSGISLILSLGTRRGDPHFLWPLAIEFSLSTCTTGAHTSGRWRRTHGPT